VFTNNSRFQQGYLYQNSGALYPDGTYRVTLQGISASVNVVPFVNDVSAISSSNDNFVFVLDVSNSPEVLALKFTTPGAPNTQISLSGILIEKAY
jgi:hypothetical protein